MRFGRLSTLFIGLPMLLAGVDTGVSGVSGTGLPGSSA